MKPLPLNRLAALEKIASASDRFICCGWTMARPTPTSRNGATA
jgi:hypothetical protein